MNPTDLLRQLCREFNASFDIGVSQNGVYARMIGSTVVTGMGPTIDDALLDCAAKAREVRK